MKVQRINLQYKNSNIINRQKGMAGEDIKSQSSLSFQGKYRYAKTLGSVFGTAGTLAALADTFVSGMFSLPLLLISTVVTAASGMIIGHEYDKDADKSGNENEICKKS